MKNKWKLAFFILLGAMGAIILILFVLASMPVERGQERKGQSSQLAGDHVSFDIRTNRADLNKVINHYLEEEGFTGPIDYQVFVTDEVELYGAFPLFGQHLQMLLTFEPEALENGDLVLKQKSITLGSLDLPVSRVMKIIQSNYKLPEWVEIQPNKETVYVSLTDMELKSDIKVRANTFNLKQDDISFTLLVPVE
ncbi:YpmS family protein [Bacillus sp. FJAT-27251]|uniref:YpmS family protein n=1 Tax=Bacillus sp. FJAT-27251 TaxID=1684142 RepID=UPI0006A7611A|nr:YpmS family protein [Bacillus sp. FJAT-27251]